MSLGERFSNWLVFRLDRLQPSERVVMVTTSLVVGFGAGLGAIVFRYLIADVQWVGFTGLPQVLPGLGRWIFVLVPAVGGLIVGPMVYFFAREAKGHGVPEVMEAVALKGGRIRPRVAVIKSLASSICIGSGGSVGREGPIVQIGSALGSSIGQLLRLSDERIRSLVACGAAGGIAATFNAPIAGVIFALEIILGEFSVSNFSVVVLASVTASVVSRAAFGDVPAFPIPSTYEITSVWEYALYPVLGLLAAVVGVVFVRALYKSEDLFDDWKWMPEWLKPAIGGVMLGGFALLYPVVLGVQWTNMPQIFGVGYDVIESALSSNQLLLVAALALVALKLLATALTLGSGGSGGVFAPSLFMGAMLGAAFGITANMLFPGITAPPGAYALVGMAAVFAASAQAPITAILILFELTGNYQIILPLMETVVIAALLGRRWLGGESVYTLKLSRRGIRLQLGRDVDLLQSVTVAEAMTRNPATVSATMTLPELASEFSSTRRHGFPVLDADDKLWGVVAVGDLKQALDAHLPSTTTVAEIGTSGNVMVAYPDEPISAALARLGTRDVGRLPVVSREDPRKLVGVVRRRDVIRAYNMALARRAEIQHRARQIQLRNLDGAEFVAVTLKEGDAAVGKKVAEIAYSMPQDCVLVSIRRGKNLVIPHGNTVFQPGDRVTAFASNQDANWLHDCLSNGKANHSEDEK
jgi:CIC family chloride channel protein